MRVKFKSTEASINSMEATEVMRKKKKERKRKKDFLSKILKQSPKLT